MRFFNTKVIGGFLIITFLFSGLFIIKAQEEEEEAPQKKVNRKEQESNAKMSFDVQEKSFADIIENIRERTGQNIIIDENIKDVFVTIKLVNTRWKNILTIIAKKYNCLVKETEVGGGKTIIEVTKPPVVTMEFEGVKIRDVINEIATIANRNIVVSEDVTGTVSLRLKDVPWEEALESIIKTRGYVLYREKDGRILRVVPPSEIEMELDTRIVKLRFIRPKSTYIAKVDSPFFSGGSTAGSSNLTGRTEGKIRISGFSLLNALNGVMSSKGKMTYDDMTNTLIISDIKPKLNKMEEIIKEMDKEPQQVLIDVKFIRTTNSDVFNFGVNVGIDDNTGLRVSQSLGSLNTRLPFTLGRGGWEDEIAVASDANLAEGLPTQTQAADRCGDEFWNP